LLAVSDLRFNSTGSPPSSSSMPGFGHLLATELLAATNGDLTNFGSADRLAGRSSDALYDAGHRVNRYSTHQPACRGLGDRLIGR
jgi:hypothetical protein